MLGNETEKLRYKGSTRNLIEISSSIVFPGSTFVRCPRLSLKSGRTRRQILPRWNERLYVRFFFSHLKTKAACDTRSSHQGSAPGAASPSATYMHVVASHRTGFHGSKRSRSMPKFPNSPVFSQRRTSFDVSSFVKPHPRAKYAQCHERLLKKKEKKRNSKWRTYDPKWV